MNNSNIFDYTQLAEASYVNFWDGNKLETNSEIMLGYLQNEDRGGKFSKTQATELLQDWSVLAQYRDRTEESSFSATLFKNKDTNEYVFACKGTAELYVDGAEADIGDMVHDGLAIYQIVDMYNFWQQINAPKGKSYKVRVLEENGVESVALAEAFFRQEQDQTGEGTALQRSLQAQGYVIESNPVTGSRRVMRFVEKDSSQIYTGDGDDRATGLGINIHPSKVTVTGHSLGGHLSAAFSRLFPKLVDDCLMINGAGYADFGTSGVGAGNIPLRPTFLSCFSH